MSASPDSKRIYYIVDDFHGCGWYRCHVPGMELKRRGYEVTLDDHITPEKAEKADVIVFQRQWLPVAVSAMEYANNLGKTTVYELDDDLWNLDPSNPAYEAWSKPGMLENVATLCTLAKVVTTTAEPLARQLRRFNRNVRILPNMLPAEHWQVQRKRPKGYDRVAIGWAGSTSRWRDLAVVKDVLPQLLDRYPNVDLLIAGDDSNMVFPPRERIRHLNPVKIEQYPTLLAEFDVGIAPVVDSRFNHAKSDLKDLEYGMLGVPTVASNVEAYVHSIANGESGFLAKNDKAWLKDLQRLVEQPDLRESMGAAAKQLAESRTIQRNAGLWEKAYGIAAGEEGSAA